MLACTLPPASAAGAGAGVGAEADAGTGTDAGADAGGSTGFGAEAAVNAGIWMGTLLDRAAEDLGRRVGTVGTRSGDGGATGAGHVVGYRTSVDGRSWRANRSTAPEDASEVPSDVCFRIVRSEGEFDLAKLITWAEETYRHK